MVWDNSRVVVVVVVVVVIVVVVAIPTEEGCNSCSNTSQPYYIYMYKLYLARTHMQILNMFVDITSNTRWDVILCSAVDSYLSIGLHNATSQVTAILIFPTIRTSNINVSVTVCFLHYMLTFHSKNTSQLSIKKFKPPLQVIFLFSAKQKCDKIYSSIHRFVCNTHCTGQGEVIKWQCTNFKTLQES